MPINVRNIRFSVLLILTVLLILVAPFLRDFIRARLILDIITMSILLASIWATGERKHQTPIALALALPFIAVTWLNYAFEHDKFLFSGNLIGILFFGYVIYSILKYIFESETVTREIIFAAIVSYLFLAVIWAFAYSALEFLFPGSFTIPDDAFKDGGYHFLYFSFVTITTLGYGDITPLTQKASSLAIIEALVGQIYLVVLVAWLVGMYVSRKSR